MEALYKSPDYSRLVKVFACAQFVLLVIGVEGQKPPPTMKCQIPENQMSEKSL